MTPAEAEMHFLENAKKLSMYGVDLHHAKVQTVDKSMLQIKTLDILRYSTSANIFCDKILQILK